MFNELPGKSPLYVSSKSIVARSTISILELGCMGAPGIAPTFKKLIVDVPADVLLVNVNNASSLFSGSLLPFIKTST